MFSDWVIIGLRTEDGSEECRQTTVLVAFLIKGKFEIVHSMDTILYTVPELW